MVHRAPPHPGHLAAGWPPDVGPDPPPRPDQQPPTRNASVPDGQRVTEFPGWLAYIGQAAISAIYGPLAAAAYRPDTAQVNYYDPGLRPWGGAVRSRLLMPYAAFAAAKTADASWKDRTPGNLAPRPGQNLRTHHDNGESISDLAVSLSLGDRCSFRLNNTANHGYLCTELTLSSGDTLVFGRQARFACHDEPGIYPGTGHPGSGLTRAASTSQCASPYSAVSEPGTAEFTRRTAADRNASVLIVPLPRRPGQKQALPQDNQHVTIQAGEILRVGRLFESQIAPIINPQAEFTPKTRLVCTGNRLRAAPARP